MASTLANVNYEVRRGDTTTFRHSLTIGDTFINSTPVNLTGWSLHGQVKYDINGDDIWVNLDDYLTVTDAANGKWEIYFDATASSTLLPIGSTDAPSAPYDIQLSKDGEEDAFTQTIQSGTLSIIADVTRPPFTALQALINTQEQEQRESEGLVLLNQ